MFWKIPEELEGEIMDASDFQTLLALSLVRKRLTTPSQSRIISRIMFSGNTEKYGFNTWFSKEKNPGNEDSRARFVKAIFYSGGEGSPLQNPEGFLSPYNRVKSLRLAETNLDPFYTPKFTALKAVSSLSLEDCWMTVQEFLEYLWSFPQLEFLSISNPIIRPSRESESKLSGRLTWSAQSEVKVALRLGSISSVRDSRPLLEALSAVPFDFTELHLRISTGLSPAPSFSSFLESAKGTVTKIKIDGESPLIRHTGHTTLCVNRNLFLS